MPGYSGAMQDDALTFRPLWLLDPAITFLNHGSFGACPRAVLARQSELRTQLESEPVAFMVRTLDGALSEARKALTLFLGGDPERLAFVPNATTGVNTITRALAPHLSPGDELLTTSHEYNACRNALEFVAELTGARVVVAEVPFPISGDDEIVERVLAACTPRTRFALIDHVTSPTALVLPVERIAIALTERGVDVMIDGAHAPGMIDLDLKALEEAGVRYYTGNLHKWTCAPKGAAFLHVAEDRLSRVRPLNISHGANAPLGTNSRFRHEFDWTGTADPTPYLCVPEAISHMGGLLPGGWGELRRRNHDKVCEARRVLSSRLGLDGEPCPEALLGSMATLSLPDGPAMPLMDALFHDHHIEVPVLHWPGPNRRFFRVSAQLYNAPTDYERLGHALSLLLNLP